MDKKITCFLFQSLNVAKQKLRDMPHAAQNGAGLIFIPSEKNAGQAKCASGAIYRGVKGMVIERVNA